MRKQHTNSFIRYWLIILCFAVTYSQAIAQDQDQEETYTEFKLEISADYRQYFKKGIFPEQKSTFFSGVIKPSFYAEWGEERNRFQFTGFARLEPYQTGRSHFDIRELYIQSVHKSLDLSVGLKKIFWGVTESVHLVDIINQTDNLEGFGGKDKLGQPMIHMAFPTKAGTFEFFHLLYFRKRQFPDVAGRFRLPIRWETLGFEDRVKEWRPEFAIRWSHSKNKIDIGLSHFYGTGREPYIERTETFKIINLLYPIINQTGIELQAVIGGIQWKMEAIRRSSKFQTFNAFATGLEYTFQNIKFTGIDIGVLTEYLFDSRGLRATTALDNDIFIGTRIALNDVQNTTFLVSGIFDLKRKSKIWGIDASRRLPNSWKLALEVRLLTDIPQGELISFFQQDGFSQIRLTKFL